MRAAFAGIVDYAGLFPPATCSMADAISSYNTYRRSPDRWMLGRFIVAASRLDGSERVHGDHPPGIRLIHGAVHCTSFHVPAEADQSGS